MADSVRGNGLIDLHNALARLEANTALLDRALHRFGGDGDGDGEPPPAYRPPSTASGTSTQPCSPEPEPDLRPRLSAADRRRQLRYNIREQHGWSRPYHQFDVQSGALAERMAMARYHKEDYWGSPPFPPPGKDRADYISLCTAEADGFVRARWQELGIWQDTWANAGRSAGPRRDDAWPHEEAADRRPNEHPVTREEAIASAAAPSRPYHQFVYQVAKERDLLLGLSRELDPRQPPPLKPWMARTIINGWDPAAEAHARQQARYLAVPNPPPLAEAAPDVHTQAYNLVREAWEQWGIWDARWTVMPGLHWQHEEPLDAFLRRRLAEEGFGEEDEGDESGAGVARQNGAPHSADRGALAPAAAPVLRRPTRVVFGLFDDAYSAEAGPSGQGAAGPARAPPVQLSDQLFSSVFCGEPRREPANDVLFSTFETQGAAGDQQRSLAQNDPSPHHSPDPDPGPAPVAAPRPVSRRPSRSVFGLFGDAYSAEAGPSGQGAAGPARAPPVQLPDAPVSSVFGGEPRREPADDVLFSTFGTFGTQGAAGDQQRRSLSLAQNDPSPHHSPDPDPVPAPVAAPRPARPRRGGRGGRGGRPRPRPRPEAATAPAATAAAPPDEAEEEAASHDEGGPPPPRRSARLRAGPQRDAVPPGRPARQTRQDRAAGRPAPKRRRLA